MNLPLSRSNVTGALGAALALAAMTLGGEAAQNYGGMAVAPRSYVRPAIANIGTISAALKFNNSGFGTGGVGLRNRSGGAISVSGVVAPIKGAFLYWAVITEGAPTSADGSILVQRVLPAPASGSAVVKGSVIGTGASPCWGGDRISVYRGQVPFAIATGNGEYQLTLEKGASGTIDGTNPWSGGALPYMDGASLVIVGGGSSTVAIYDKGLSAQTFGGNPGLEYSLKLPITASGNAARFDNIGADGQHGASVTSDPGTSNERTTMNGKIIAGPGSTGNDGDWNGSSALPLPQLWDDTGHDVSTVVTSGTTALKIAIANGGQSSYDCLTPVANVISF